MNELNFNPHDFAAAYIQTLDIAIKKNDGESDDEFLNRRADFYLNEYIRAQQKTTEFTIEYQELADKEYEKNK